MLFNSLVFLYFFLPIAYFVFWRLRTKSHRYIWLTLAGYVFYSFWNYKFCALMAISTLVSYLAGLGFLRFESPGKRRLCLIAPISFDLALLGVFKYANFALTTFQNLGQTLGFSVHVPTLDIILPVGISFYTFHTITYIVDSYRRTITPTRNFFEFSCYVSLFSQLVAGPIVRFREIEKDLELIDRDDTKESLDRGWSFFALGMIKKVVIADSIAAVIDPALMSPGGLSSVGVWMCILGYTYQLYFDFSGYSDMAVGLGLMFGLRLPQNFDSPYKALDIADFWRRWHISLSSVLRDYLYIPLGGSRHGSLLTYRNLLITMLLGGLWHGANWTFVAWGAYHGLLLGGTRLFAESIDSWPNHFRRAITFLLVVIGWVLFRSDTFGTAVTLMSRMFMWRSGALPVGWPILAVALAVSYCLAHFGPNTFELSHRWSGAQLACISFLFLFCLILMYGEQQSPFLYFQF
jgi:alginate O-acetyltransferase complex protein AlgI